MAYATEHREVKPNEQHTHSFLEVLPLMALSMTSALHWAQLQAAVGIGKETPRWGLRMKKRRLPTGYLWTVAGVIVGGTALPYANEMWRCWKARQNSEPKAGS